MKHIQEYLQVNEGLKDSFVNIFKNFFGHNEVSNKKFVTIDIDPRVFGAFTRDENYFKKDNKDYPKLIPYLSAISTSDLWELYHLELSEDKYGNTQEIFTYIGHADFRKNNHKIEVEENYKELVDKIIKKYQ